MKHTQNTNQEQKKHFLTSHKSIRFTAALCAAAVLVGGVAYAATPDAIAAEPTTAVSESTFTDVVATTYDETEFPSSDQIRLEASVDGAIILTVIHQKEDAAAADQKHIPSGWPVESRIVSTEFNPTADPSISDGRKHEGMDISTKSQIIPIYATAAGTVVTANFRSDYGNQVIIDHGNGYETSYSHLSKISVVRNQQVRRGDIIALSGDTGLSLAPHLHYEVRLGGVRVDPIHYFFMELSPDEYQRIVRIAQSGMQSFD